MLVNELQEFDTEHTVKVDKERAPTKNMTGKITTYLRWTGSILIILSAVGFMLQGNDEILPAYRYWIGLGLTLLLCGGGLVCAYLFNETKGARIFFGLGAAFLPVQVTQVSAMIYAYWHGQQALQPEYSWLQFMDVSPYVIALDLAITGLLLFFISYASYSILARKHLKTLLWASAIGNLLLILPIRDTSFTPFIIVALFIFIRQIEHFLLNDLSMHLKEGIAARALISLPLWIMVGRSLLHPGSWLLAITVSAIIVAYTIYDIKRYTQSKTIIYISQWVGTFTAIFGWFIILAEFSGISSYHFSLFLPVAAILFVLSFRVERHAHFYRLIGSIITLFLTYSAMLDQQTIAPIISIAAGTLLILGAVKNREKISLLIGNLCVAGGFLFYLEYAINFYSNTPWVSSIVLGLVIIMLASYIENKENKIMEKSRHFYNELKHWD